MNLVRLFVDYFLYIIRCAFSFNRSVFFFIRSKDIDDSNGQLNHLSFVFEQSNFPIR